MDKLVGRIASAFIICCLLLAALIVAPYGSVAYAEGEEARVLHEGTKLYADVTLTTVKLEVPRNAVIDIKESVSIEGATYYRAVYAGEEGYIKAEYVYSARFYNPELKIRSMICLADKVGAKANVYAAPDKDSEVLYTLEDGARLEVAECAAEGYYAIINDERGGYIAGDNLTDGLSRNYRVALAIGCVCIVIVVAVFILVYVRKNKEYIENHKNNRIAAQKKVVEEDDNFIQG